VTDSVAIASVVSAQSEMARRACCRQGHGDNSSAPPIRVQQIEPGGPIRPGCTTPTRPQ
jgi:hypothetical protein